MSFEANFAALLFYAGMVVDSLLTLLTLWGLIGFFPRRSTRGESAASWLILAIWLGFLGAFLHVVSNGLVGRVIVYFELVDAHFWHVYVKGAADILWDAIAGLSIYLHFYARYRSIPAEDQSLWHPLLMGFYPDLTHWAVKTGQRMQALYRRN